VAEFFLKDLLCQSGLALPKIPVHSFTGPSQLGIFPNKIGDWTIRLSRATAGRQQALFHELGGPLAEKDFG
jgi:hypothetical protein